MSNMILPAVLGGMMTFIAFRQWRTSYHTLKLSLFDRRMKVYLTTRLYLARRAHRNENLCGDAKLQVLGSFVTDTASYEFLFKKDVTDFMKEVFQNESSDIDRQWYQKQYRALPDLFKPYLDFSKL